MIICDTDILEQGQPNYGGGCETFEVVTSIWPQESVGLIASLSATTLYYEHDWNYNKNVDIKVSAYNAFVE